MARIWKMKPTMEYMTKRPMLMEEGHSPTEIMYADGGVAYVYLCYGIIIYLMW